ncbi:hypothetical protein STEG23_014402, partial [Scotinomys teguina]
HWGWSDFMSEDGAYVPWTLRTTDKILDVQSSVCVAEWGVMLILSLKSLISKKETWFHLKPYK